jgi:hypothetical protein
MDDMSADVCLFILMVFGHVHQLLLLGELAGAFVEFGKPGETLLVELIDFLLVVGEQLFLIAHR